MSGLKQKSRPYKIICFSNFFQTQVVLFSFSSLISKHRKLYLNDNLELVASYEEKWQIFLSHYYFPMEKLEMSMHLGVKNKLFIMYGLKYRNN